jgi:hypothetical protein
MSDEAIIREALKSAKDFWLDADAGEDYELCEAGIEALDRLVEALRACVQYGVDEDDHCWVCVDPTGIDLAVRVLGITEEQIRKEQNG